jgi:hypothetical protein
MTVLSVASGWAWHWAWIKPDRAAAKLALEAAIAKQRAMEQLYDDLQRAYAGCRAELDTLTAHTMARHKARSEAALRGHATRRAASAVAAAQPTMDNCAAYMQPRPPVVGPEVQS